MNFLKFSFLIAWWLYSLSSPLPVKCQQTDLPKNYVCYRADSPLLIDGKALELCWKNAPWTDDFCDIIGNQRPKPLFQTRVKMLWNSEYLYVYAEIMEPSIWANLKKRDDVIFRDNDFEVFIDPDGDTQNYYEYEMNALNTQWDLRLTKPYRDGGIAITSWNFEGMKSAVNLEGTINDPKDIDRYWSVEIAFPMKSFIDSTAVIPVKSGDQWRINFSRVEWQTKIEDGRYVKKIDSKTGKLLPEENWVWSPQGTVNMHCPEKWGFVQFSDRVAGEAITSFQPNPEEAVKNELRLLYYAQKNYYFNHQKYAGNLVELGSQNQNLSKLRFTPAIITTSRGYEFTAKLPKSRKIWHLNESGRVWTEK